MISSIKIKLTSGKEVKLSLEEFKELYKEMKTIACDQGYNYWPQTPWYSPVIYTTCDTDYSGTIMIENTASAGVS